MAFTQFLGGWRMTASMLLLGDGACVRAAANCNEYAAQRPT
jgi:hypothetical protein